MDRHSNQNLHDVNDLDEELYEQLMDEDGFITFIQCIYDYTHILDLIAMTQKFPKRGEKNCHVREHDIREIKYFFDLKILKDRGHYLSTSKQYRLSYISPLKRCANLAEIRLNLLDNRHLWRFWWNHMNSSMERRMNIDVSLWRIYQFSFVTRNTMNWCSDVVDCVLSLFRNGLMIVYYRWFA